MSDQHYLTKEKIEELRNELETLKTTKRLEIADRLKAAKELGDLSENAEYHEAREEQQLVETRIVKLEDMLRNATVIKMQHGGKTIRIGSTFTCENNGKEFKFTLVGADEVNPSEGRISNESPLGSGFIDKKVGDNVVAQTPAGKSTYKVTSIA